MSHRVRETIIRFWVDNNYRVAHETSLDPTERLILFEVYATQELSHGATLATPATIARTLGMHPETVRRRLRAMTASPKNNLERTAQGQYRLRDIALYRRHFDKLTERLLASSKKALRYSRS